MFPTLGPLVPGVRKIAVLRANLLGDYVFTVPALEALRAAYPAAEVVLLGKAWHRDFLADRPGPVDRVVVLPTYGGVGSPAGVSAPSEEVDRFFASMRAERFDVAVQLHGGGGHSNAFVRRLGARLTVGLRAADAPPLDRDLPYVYFQPEILRYLEVVSLIGATPVSLEPSVAVVERDDAEAGAVVPPGTRPCMAIHPGATDPRRWWPAEKFAAVADALAGEGYEVLVTGTAGERDLVGRVTRAMRAPARDVSGRVSTGGLAGLLKRCALVISNDSGPLHLAMAVGTPTVGLFWCLNLINGGHATRARHRPLLSFRFDCPVCGRNCMEGHCGHDDSFLADIPVEQVLAAARELLRTPALADQR